MRDSLGSSKEITRAMYSSHRQFRRCCAASLLLVSLANTGCEVWHTERVAPESVLIRRKPHFLRVTRSDGSRSVFEAPVLRADSLSALVADKPVAIPLNDIQRVETLHFSAGRSIGLVVGVGAATVAAVIAIFLITCPGTTACSN